MNSDWSQFIPSLIVGIIVLILGWIFTILASKKFRDWFYQIIDKLDIKKHFLIAKYRWIKYRGFFLICILMAILGVVYYLISSDWISVVLSGMFFLLGS